MAYLRHVQLRSLSTAAGELAQKFEAGISASNFFLRAVSRLISLDRVSYNEVDRPDGRLVTAHSYNESPDPSLIQGLNRFIHEHPGFSRVNPRDPWPAPTMLSDHLSQRQFRQLGLYQEHFRLYGIHHQLGVSFAVSPERRISFGLNRTSRNFTEEDRLMLGLLREPLAAAWRRAQADAEVASALLLRDEALAGANAVMVLDRSGEIAYSNELANRLMARHGVRALLLAEVHRRLAAGGSNGTWITKEWADGRLLATLTRTPSTEGWHLLRLKEWPVANSARPLEALGLAKREAETLFWLARGKRNAEIATICNMQSTTVSTHLRAVFSKLGVETRTAAAAMAWEILSEGAGKTDG